MVAKHIAHHRDREAFVHLSKLSQSFQLEIFFCFVKTNLLFVYVINKNAACGLLFNTKTKYLKNIICVPLRERKVVEQGFTGT